MEVVEYYRQVVATYTENPEKALAEETTELFE